MTDENPQAAAVPQSPAGVGQARDCGDGLISPVRFASREFSFSGGLASVPESSEQVMQFAQEHCHDKADQIDILVALQEALINAVLHGCGDNTAKKIQCVVVISASEIAITIHDPGLGFDLALADPESYEGSSMSYGRGSCLMRSLMTEVTFARGGAEIRLRKHIDQV